MSDDSFPFPAHIGTVGSITVNVDGEGRISAYTAAGQRLLFCIGPAETAELAATLLAAAERAPALKAAYDEAVGARDRAVELLELEVETILNQPDKEES